MTGLHTGCKHNPYIFNPAQECTVIHGYPFVCLIPGTSNQVHGQLDVELEHLLNDIYKNICKYIAYKYDNIIRVSVKLGGGVWKGAKLSTSLKSPMFQL